MLTRKQHQLLKYIHERLEANGISPSFEEMKEALDLKSKSGVHRLVNALEERGFIRRLPNRARALEVTRLPEGMRSTPAELRDDSPLRKNDNVERIEIARARKAGRLPPALVADIVELPLHGRIAAGMPIEAFEDHETLPVPAALLGNGEHYALEVAGDSMIEAGILDGDYALIQRTDQARDGEIVVALIRNEEATLKYLRREGRNIRLDPANASYDAQIYDASEVQIQGRLSGLLRRYH